MPAAQLHIDDLLDPISAGQPAGTDLRWTPEWDRIKEARRADDPFESGKWIKKERKESDWRLVKELATSSLRNSSKDLQLALWLTEANIKLQGFDGLKDGLYILRELMVRYWDTGLYPSMESGTEDRAGPFEWLNDKLADSFRAIPITHRADSGQDYSLIDLEDARRTGSEAGYKTDDGEIDSLKKRVYEQALATGHISMEMFEKAVKETQRADYEEFNSTFQQTYEEFKALEKTIDEKFGDPPPNLSACRAAFKDIQLAVEDILEKKRKAEPDKLGVTFKADAATEQPAHRTADAAGNVVLRLPLAVPDMQSPGAPASGSWQDAQNLIRSGQVEKGLAEMMRLAASETTGRNRFERKLVLAEVCLNSKRERLARPILEELAEQIDKFQLEHWESSELISSVWSRLYRLYRQSEDPSDLERAAKLYLRLCRLDPWQALNCGEG